MRRSQSNERTEDESSGVLGNMRGNIPTRTPDQFGSLFFRGRASKAEDMSDNSGGELEQSQRGSTSPGADDSGSWFGRARAKYGLGTLLVGAGVVLFLFPEPVTSTAGLALIGAGVALWLLG